jgi:CelD/BcsL family acetyltransferase involved in cellulose biosynthesis
MDFKLYSSFPEELEQEWNALLDESITQVPFLRFEYVRIWWQTCGGGEWPEASLAIVTARNDGRLVGIAPLFLTPSHDSRPSLFLLGSVEVSDYLDLIVRSDDLHPFINGLLLFLKEAQLPEWQALDLYNILNSSPSLLALKDEAEKAGWSYQEQILQHSPFISLPGDWEAYLAKIDKKQRHEVRRKMRRLEEADVPVRWYIVDNEQNLDAEIEDFLGLMGNDPEKAAFLTPAMRTHMHLTIQCAFHAQCLNLTFLEIDGKKAAGYVSFHYLNRLWVYNSGLDPQFSEYSPGWVLLGYLLKWANENQIDEFDFMRGNEEYKYRFGAVDRFVMRATLTPPAKNLN